MHIVIAGAGEVGYNLAKVLCDNHDVFVIEKDEEKVDQIQNLNVDAVQGNAANVKVLKRANVDRADIFLAVTGSDEVNLLAGIAARKLGAKKIIVRVGNPEYVERPIVKDHPMGYDLIICPQLALANEIANLIMIPGAIEFISLSGGKADMIEIIVSDESPIVGKKISELNLPRNVIITAIYRKGDLIVPKGDTTIEAGDVLTIFGGADDIAKVKRMFGNIVVKNVVIFGGGTIGSYIARILDNSRLNVKLVDSDIKVCERLSEILRHVKVVFGDATDLDFLIEEEIGKADVVIATTESDEKNLLISLLSKNLGAKEAIAKVEKGSYVKLFESVGVDYALSPRRVTFIEVMKYLRLVDIRTIADVRLEATVLEVNVKNRALSGKRIADIRLPKKSIIGGILRRDDFIIPRGDTEIRLGDRLLIFTTWDEIDEIEEIFE